MSCQDFCSSEIKDAFDDLTTCFSIKNSAEFLKKLWLLPCNTNLSSILLERMIYYRGCQSEVYNAKERALIERYNTEIYFYSYEMNAGVHQVPCMVTVVNFYNCADFIKESIAYMKIFNKAIYGFNTFVFVAADGVAFGCSCINGSSIGQDCVISPKVTRCIDWDLFFDLFLMRSDSVDFYLFYSGLVGCILSICECFDNKSHDYYDFKYSYDYDSDLLEDARNYRIKDWIANCKYEGKDEYQYGFDKEDFIQEVKACMNSLTYIVSNRVNPLELLFEAERNMENQQTFEKDVDVHSTSETHNYGILESSTFAMLDDPVSLIKQLKKERGL